jgi:hypothetical protein
VNLNLEILGKKDEKGWVVGSARKGVGKQCFHPAIFIEIKMEEKMEIYQILTIKL